MCAVCGTDWCGFGGVSVQQVAFLCVWDSLIWVWWSDCMLCVGQFCVRFDERMCSGWL